jgi:hypothetical protein
MLAHQKLIYAGPFCNQDVLEVLRRSVVRRQEEATGFGEAGYEYVCECLKR